MNRALTAMRELLQQEDGQVRTDISISSYRAEGGGGGLHNVGL